MGDGIVEWAACADVPGLMMTLRVRDDDQVWRAFHETYTICNSRCLATRGSEWAYRGRMHTTEHDGTMLLEPGETHATIRQFGPVSFDVFFLDPNAVKELAHESEATVGAPHFASANVRHPRLHGALRRLMKSLRSAATALERESRFMAVMHLMLRDHADRTAAVRRREGDHPALKHARDYLHAHIAENITLDELSRVACMSRFHLIRKFKTRFGVPPHEYQLLLRIDAAARRLVTGAAIADVGSDLGFADQSHFGRHFRRIIGLAPGTFATSVRRRSDRS